MRSSARGRWFITIVVSEHTSIAIVRHDGVGFPRSVLLLGDDDGGPNVFDMLQHENGVLLCVLQLLE